ncbi:putative SNARE associated golgi family protein [Helianthus annuus]|nr:putative SNARE associated golgi family protein [Helianthus annuus]
MSCQELSPLNYKLNLFGIFFKLFYIPRCRAFAYVPLTVLAVPASVLTLGGGYLFGLATGFLADSTGAVLGATAAFLLGRTIGRPYVIAKLGDYPQFRAIAIAIEKSGFKIVLLLRLVPLLPFNMMNYLLSVTPISICEYVMASWLGMMPITFALVYCGTTLKNLSDVTHGWGPFSKTRWVRVAFFVLVLYICVYDRVRTDLEKKKLKRKIISPNLLLLFLHTFNINRYASYNHTPCIIENNKKYPQLEIKV